MRMAQRKIKMVTIPTLEVRILIQMELVEIIIMEVMKIQMVMETIKRAKVVGIIRVVLGMAIKKINKLIILEIPEVGVNLL
jgi:hypothetical protein